MSQKRALSPPLATIESRLFGVSIELMDAVEAGQTSTRIAKSVKKSPEWAERHTGEAERTVSDEAVVAAPMPAYLRELVSRRVAAMQTKFDPVPSAGQIVEVRRIVTPEPNQLDWVMQVPLYVLLDAQAEKPDLWHGWLATAETDYATWWDFVLQEDDGPFDPEAGMVQLWNPVRLYLPMAGRAVAQLPLARLQAARALAGEFLTSDPPKGVKAWPGRVAARETLHGLGVVTGSPLGSNADPRRRYQQLYFHAAEAVREPARLALAVLQSPKGRLAALLDGFVAAARRAGEHLLPVPPVSVAMGGKRDGSGGPILSTIDSRLASEVRASVDAHTSLDAFNEGHTPFSSQSHARAISSEIFQLYIESQRLMEKVTLALRELPELMQRVETDQMRRMFSARDSLQSSLKMLELLESKLAEQQPPGAREVTGESRRNDRTMFLILRAQLAEQMDLQTVSGKNTASVLADIEMSFARQTKGLSQAIGHIHNTLEKVMNEREYLDRALLNFERTFNEAYAAAMKRRMTATETQPQDLLWRDVARIHDVHTNPDGSGRLHISAIGSEAVTCEFRAGAMPEDRLTISPGAPGAQFEWDGTKTTVLVLKTASGLNLELPIAG